MAPMDPRSRCGWLPFSRQTGTFSDLVSFTFSVIPVASVEMSVTVDYLKLLDIDHLL